MEEGNIDQIIRAPKHPYTQVLLESVPVADPKHRWAVDETVVGEEIRELPGRERCLFAERCPHAVDRCLAARPKVVSLEDGRQVACTLYY